MSIFKAVNIHNYLKSQFVLSIDFPDERITQVEKNVSSNIMAMIMMPTLAGEVVEDTAKVKK